MNDIRLLGKKVIMDKSEILLDYKPGDDWKNFWTVKSGNWSCEAGYIIGDEPENKGGILFSKDCYDDNVMMTFTGKTVLPATRDLNAVFCARWDEKTDYLGTSYVCGLNGWYENKSGIETKTKTREIKVSTNEKADILLIYIFNTETRRKPIPVVANKTPYTLSFVKIRPLKNPLSLLSNKLLETYLEVFLFKGLKTNSSSRILLKKLLIKPSLEGLSL